MYSALWRVLPGKTVSKIMQLLVIGVIVVVILFEWVFPYIAMTFFVEQSTVS
jgi:hypothetical protein